MWSTLWPLQVTNHMVMGDDGNLRPALGESWKAVPHARLLVEKEQEGSQCTATLVKHSRLVHPRHTAPHHTTPNHSTHHVAPCFMLRLQIS